MSVRAQQYAATVTSREQLASHLVRVVLDVPGFESTGIPDEWVGLIVPGQFQSRYYTVRWLSGDLLALDIALHRVGLVAEWAAGQDIVGQAVTLTEPKGSFALPDAAQWLLLVGDITALPAMARIAEQVAAVTGLPTRVWAEIPDPGLRDYLPQAGPSGLEVSWFDVAEDASALASIVESIDWPEGEGYFWMAGESAQMRAVRKHLMRERHLPSHAYDVMGYWRASAGRQPRAVDPGPIYAAGKAAGKSDAEIWSDYDAAQARQTQQQAQQ